jgi:membrane-associated phospholipid phosphatase
MQPRFRPILLSLSLWVSFVALGQAPASSSAANDVKECGIKAIPTCALHVAQDEWGIVTAPLRLREPNVPMVAAFGLGTTLALATDTDAMAQVGVNPSRERNANKYSNYAGLYGPPAALTLGYFVGSARHNHHLQVTTILAEEAMVDSFILNTALGYAIDRQTPTQGDGKGNIWPNGTKTWPDGQSMPSDHSILAWSFAHVVASEYPGLGTKLAVYSLATSVSAARVVARKHFPSDVFVGGALGYYIGGYVVRRRSTESSFNDFSLAPVRTPNGTGIEVSYDFAH